MYKHIYIYTDIPHEHFMCHLKQGRFPRTKVIIMFVCVCAEYFEVNIDLIDYFSYILYVVSY